MQNYMTRLNNIKKYILPFLFLVMTFVMIPKAAYYKKGNIDIAVTTTEGNWGGRIHLFYPMGYKMEAFRKEVKGEGILHQRIKNTVLVKYIFDLKSSIGEVKELKFTSEKKEVTISKSMNQKYFDISWKDISKIYEISILNGILYLVVALFLVWYYLKKGINITLTNIGIFSLALVLLSITLNLKWLSKINGLFLSITVLKIYLDKRKIIFGYLEIISLILLMLSLISEHFNFFNYEKTYIYFQNTLLILIIAKIWNFNYDEKKILKNLFKISLIILALINIVSPLIFGGGYSFTFGVLMTILVADSLENLTFNYRNKFNFIINGVSLLMGVYGLIVSSRRTMIVALSGYCIYLFFKILKNNRRKALALLFSGVLIFLTVIGIGFRGERHRIKELVVSIGNMKTDKSSIQRFLMWRRGYYMSKENPFIGIGVDSFYKESIKEKYNSIKDNGEQFEAVFIHAHNEYIQQIISRGIPGAILFYGLWIYMLSRLRKSEDKDFDIMLLIIYGVYGIFDPYSIRAESIVFYTFIGISFVNCLPVVEKENKILQKLGYISTVIIFLIALYFNKRFRYYFLILLVIYIGYYFYNKRKREKYERI